MIVHTKLLAELLELNAAAGELALANWFFWLELFLTALFGIYWLFRLSQCLGMYAPLTLIILSAAHGHRPPAWACSLTTRRVPRVPQVRPPLYHSSHADCLHHLRRHRWWHLLSGIRSHGRGSLLRALYAAHARTARVRPTRTCPFASPFPLPVATFWSRSTAHLLCVIECGTRHRHGGHLILCRWPLPACLGRAAAKCAQQGPVWPRRYRCRLSCRRHHLDGHRKFAVGPQWPHRASVSERNEHCYELIRT